MMAILHFDLPDDQDSYDSCVNASSTELAIGEFSSKLRSMYKYENIETASVYDIRQLLYDTFIEYNLSTDLL
jgi:hypothetical protein